MLVLILVDFEYSQKAVFSFGKGLNCQNHSSSGSLHLVKKRPSVKFSPPPPTPGLLENPWGKNLIWRDLEFHGGGGVGELENLLENMLYHLPSISL